MPCAAAGAASEVRASARARTDRAISIHTLRTPARVPAVSGGVARYLTAVLLSLAALLPLSGAVGREPAPILAFGSAVPHGGPHLLVRVNPVTLRRVDSRAVELDGHLGPGGRSPDRSRAALVRSERPHSLRLVDLRHMRSLGDVPLGARSDVLATAWLSRERVFLVGDSALVVVDAARRRLVERIALDGHVHAHTVAGGRLVLLVAPDETIGPARLLVVDPTLGLREVSLGRVRAGSEGDTVAMPGLAVDPSGRHAWVFAVDTTAVVDLQTLGVEHFAAPRAPASSTKGERLGSVRHAVWIGAGRIGVTGFDRPSLSSLETTIGLLLVDTRTREVRTLVSGASLPHGPLVYAHAGMLLTVAGDCDDGPGLTTYTAQGERRFRHCEPNARGDVLFARGRAYLGRSDFRFAVVDLSSGAVLARPRETVYPLSEG